jgi:formylmethanofuran dehydrogenase subunit E
MKGDLENEADIDDMFDHGTVAPCDACGKERIVAYSKVRGKYLCRACYKATKKYK